MNRVPAFRRFRLPYFRRFTGIFLAAIFICLFFSVPAFGVTGYRVNSSSVDPKVVPGSVAISGTYVVWADNRSGVKQIYYKNLIAGAADAQVSSSAFEQVSPAVSGSVVVWQENNDLYYKNLAGGVTTRLTDNGATYPKQTPAIHRDRVVWSDGSHGTYSQIYTKLLTDTGNGAAVDTTDTASNQYSPTVSGDYIIWQKQNGMAFDLRIKKITSIIFGPQDFCTASGDQVDPKVSGNLVVWTDTRNGVSQTYYFDLNNPLPADLTQTGLRLSPTASNQTHPDASVNRIVWSDDRAGSADRNIYMKDLSGGTETPLVTDALDQNYPAISGDKVAWETYSQGSVWGWDVYFTPTDGGAGLTVFSTGFETGSVIDAGSGWTVGYDAGKANAHWLESTLKAHIGTRSLWMAGEVAGAVNTTGQYVNNMGANTLRKIDLTGFNRASMTFWYWMKWADASDTLYIQWSDEATPTTWNNFSPWLDKNTGVSGAWTQYTADLTPCLGKVVNIRWQAYTDVDLTDIGAFIDDVSVTAGTAASLHHIQVTPASQTMPAGGTQTFTAVGRDQYENVVPGLTFTWSVTGGTISSTTGSSTIFTAPTVPGAGSVTVTSGAVSSTPTAITVTPGPLNHIHLTPASQTLSIGGTQTFTAVGHDQYENVISGLTFNWSATGGGVSPTTGSSTTYTAGTAAGGYNVYVSAAGVPAAAPVTINPGPLNHIDVTAGSTLVLSGTGVSITASGQDQYHNVVGGLTYAWSATGGTVNPTSSGASTTYTAGQTAGSYQITATSGGFSGQAAVTVPAIGAFPNGLVVKLAGATDVYFIEAGKRRPITSGISFISNAFSWSRIVTISPDTFNGIPPGDAVMIRAGMVVKGPYSSDCYVTDYSGATQQKHAIASAPVFEYYGLHWEDLMVISQAEIDAFSPADPLSYMTTHPNGMLIKAPNDPAVYYTDHGYARVIGSAYAFASWGLRWDRVLTIDPAELTRYTPGGTPLPLRSGTLVKEYNGTAVYIIDSDGPTLIKRPISSAATFTTYGLSWSDIVAISAPELAAYTEIAPL